MYVSNLLFPKLRSAKTVGCYFFCGCYYESQTISFKHSFPITELHIHDSQDSYGFEDPDLHWDNFQELRVLHLHIELSRLFYGANYLEWPRYVDILSRSHARSLQEFHLYSNELYCSNNGILTEMAPHCPGQPSLKHFSKLKSLALTDMSLMGVSSTSGPTHWRQSAEDTLHHLADMLPTSLEAFNHLVWVGAAPFDKALTKRQRVLRSWDRIWSAADKKQFPNLKRVMVQKYGLYGLSEETEVIWERGG